MAGAAARAKKARARRPWSKEDIRLLKSTARKEPAAKIARALKRTEGSKGKERTHLAQHDQKKRVPATTR